MFLSKIQLVGWVLYLIETCQKNNLSKIMSLNGLFFFFEVTPNQSYQVTNSHSKSPSYSSIKSTFNSPSIMFWIVNLNTEDNIVILIQSSNCQQRITDWDEDTVPPGSVHLGQR